MTSVILVTNRLKIESSVRQFIILRLWQTKMQMHGTM